MKVEVFFCPKMKGSSVRAHILIFNVQCSILYGPNEIALFLNGNNIAFVPGTNTAVSINNINGGANAGVFNDNTAGQYPLFEADGFTLALDALGVVQAGTNVLKLAIADTSDCSIDSW